MLKQGDDLIKLYHYTIVSLLVLLLCGCSLQDPAETEIINETTHEVTHYIETVETEESTETEPILYEDFGMTLQDLSNIVNNGNIIGDFVTYSTQSYIVYRTGSLHSGAIFFGAPESEFISAAYFLTYANEYSQSQITWEAEAAANKIYSQCKKNGVRCIMRKIIVDNTMAFAVFSEDCPLNYKFLPISVADLRDPGELLASVERLSEIKQMISYCDYNGLVNYIENFEASKTVLDNDIELIKSLKEKAAALKKLSENCVIEKDTVEKNAQIYYGGASEIGTEVNFVPFMETDSNAAIVTYRVGFRRSNWIFFDTIYIASDGTETKSYAFDYDCFVHDSEGSGVCEYIDIKTEVKEDIVNAIDKPNSTIRFENSDEDKYIDHSFTEAEKLALPRIEQINILHNELVSIVLDWENA